MKNFLTYVAALALTIIAQGVQAQTYTMNWATAFAPVWSTGNIIGNANNIGGSAVNLNVQLVKSGGVYTTMYDTYGGPMTPTVSASPYIVGGSSSNIAIALEFATNTDYMDAIFTFNKPVFNVSFNLGDIDRLNNTSYNYLDQITITGYNGALSGSPTITKYDPVTDPNFIIISGNKAYVNPANGMAGNSNTDASDQRGTIKVKFGGVYITSFRVRYDNFPGAIADPTVQNIAIGNITFNTSIPLPVTISSFDGKANDNGTIGLNWSAEHEYNFDYYALERSENGTEFKEIGRTNSNPSESANHYSFNDINPGSSKNYYRLRMTDFDGSYSYSKVVSVTSNKIFGFKVYPTVFTQNVNLAFYSPKPGKISFTVFNMMGEKIKSLYYHANEGNNQFFFNLPGSIPKGQYYVREDSSNRSVVVLKQ
jgi:hypothetical protein